VNTATAESPRETILDALAVFMALERNDRDSADAMFASYAATGETIALTSAIAAIAQCAVRYAAIANGTTPERLLAGVVQEVRELP
jgi:hypothetical protein